MNTNEQIALVSLNNMFKDGHFSICVVDRIIKLLSVVPDRETYSQLSALHCVNWRDMPRDLYRQIPEMIKTCLGTERMHRFYLADEPTAVGSLVSTENHQGQMEYTEPKKPLLQRWLNG